jgi:hypothetical protein
MKKSLSVLTVIFVMAQFLHSQNCTQCDNTGNPPGNYASEIGVGTTATGTASFAGGNVSTANGIWSFAFGNHSITDGTSSVAIGQFLQATGLQSMVIGTGASLSNKLTNGISKSLMIGFGSEKPTLFVGGTGPGLTGKVGIGDVTNPQAKLHIKADDGEAAEVFIEPQQFGVSSGATLWLGTKDYGIRSRWGTLEFKVGEAGSYLFNEGKIGIGTSNPTARLQVKDGDIYIEDMARGIIMKSPDGQCWRGKLDNSGTLHFEQIDCGTLVGLAAEPGSQPTQQVRIYPNPAGEEINIEYTRNGSAFATIKDMNGALILQQELKVGVNRIGLQNLSTGYYLVSVMDRSNLQLASEKIVKR